LTKQLSSWFKQICLLLVFKSWLDQKLSSLQFSVDLSSTQRRVPEQYVKLDVQLRAINATIDYKPILKCLIFGLLIFIPLHAAIYKYHHQAVKKYKCFWWIIKMDPIFLNQSYNKNFNFKFLVGYVSNNVCYNVLKVKLLKVKIQ
jgi:hypothetical protein